LTEVQLTQLRDFKPPSCQLFPILSGCPAGNGGEHFRRCGLVLPEVDKMDHDKTRFYQDEAAKCRRMAADENCGDAREYYEALERDFIKLAALEQGKPAPASRRPMA
jgi:hypothetical protein